MMDEESRVTLASLQSEGGQALAQLFARFGERLERLVRLRMDARLAGRIDPGDVLQEAYLAGARRLHRYLAAPVTPVFIWLRSLTLQALVDIHRRHLDAKSRSASLEVSLYGLYLHGDGSTSLDHALAARLATPNEVLEHEEDLRQLWGAVDRLPPLDREILVLRHAEGLDNKEAAAVLGLRKAAASNRYARALKRLKTLLAPGVPGPDPRSLGNTRPRSNDGRS